MHQLKERNENSSAGSQEDDQ
jgi:hypothetical protein